MELVAFGCSSTHMDGVVDCLSPVSGVSGLGRHIGKEGKKKHCDKKKKKKDAFGGRSDDCSFHFISTRST